MKMPLLPNLRKRFKKGDKVTCSYHYPTEPKKHYRGTVKRVGQDFIDVIWQPSGREIRSWDWAVKHGSGYTSAIRKAPKRRK